MNNFSGSNLSNLWQFSDAKSRSISPENFTGEKGRGGMSEDFTVNSAGQWLGRGWKVSPFIKIATGETAILADIEGPGSIRHIWMTLTGVFRFSILRIYWDGCEYPSVECPAGDFFANAYQGFSQLSSLPVCVNPGSAFNCYWEMPFKKSCKITLENISNEEITAFYQIDYVLAEVVECAYFHAQFRRTNPLPYKETYTIVDGIQGKGQYVGTYMAWGVNNSGWWGEGEIKFFIDGDREFPTICGTGTEDYFCGSYNFDVNGKYIEFTTPYAGMPRVIRPDGLYNSQQRFSLYRWHITDPVYFDSDLKITIQALGWRSGGRFLPMQDDISSVAFWYQTLPHAAFPTLPDADGLEII